MADEDGFLGRWSRRKRAAAMSETAVPEPTASESAGIPAPEPEAEPFDIASLPPVESLTAESDIRDFLRKEVPEALRNAALRRIWSEDPFIRSYIGPADYAWDFNDPASIPGFGALEAEFDLPGHLDRMIGAPSPPVPAAADAGIGQESVSSGASTPPASGAVAGVEEAGEEADPAGGATGARAAEAGETADVQEKSEENQGHVPRRRHGGAVPV